VFAFKSGYASATAKRLLSVPESIFSFSSFSAVVDEFPTADLAAVTA